MADYGYKISNIDFDANFFTGEWANTHIPLNQFDLYSWGNNQYGRIGDNSTINKSSPILITGSSSWKQIECKVTQYFATAVKTDGTLWTWGYNVEGALGDGTTINRSSPVQTIAEGKNWKQVSSSFHIMAVKTDGSLWGWGSNSSGQLGFNVAGVLYRSSPVQLDGPKNWKQVSCGSNFTCAIKIDGTLWSWGTAGAHLGINSYTALLNYSSPVQIGSGQDWKVVSAGIGSTDAGPNLRAHGAAIKSDGTLWLWGYNTSGQLATNDLVDRSSPVQTISSGTWKQVSCGDGTTCAIKSDNTLWSWGYNPDGELGDNTIISRSSPVQIGSASWKQVFCTNLNTHGIKTDGTLWSWGRSLTGNLGDSGVAGVDRSSPVQLGTDTTWTSVGGGAAIKNIGYY
jgi:alpha-tubulin suppressor-like RCC1 family protein